MSMRAKNPYPLFFSIILVMSIVGFATSLSVSPPQLLGSGSADVEAPPGVSVTSVTWTLADNPSLVDKMYVTVSFTSTFSGTVYVIVKGADGKVLYTNYFGLINYVSSVTSEFNFDPDLSASAIASVAVTVVPA